MVYARILFGLSAVVLGVAMYLSSDAELWQKWTAVPLALGGIGMCVSPIARLASYVTGAVLLIVTLMNVPGMISAPTNPGSYIDFFEQLSMVCGPLALYAIADSNTTRSAALIRVARLTLGVCTASFAWAQVIFLQYTASLVPTWIPPGQMFWTILTTIAFALAAIAMLVNLQARLAMQLTALMMGLFGILVWVPHIVAEPAKLSNYVEIGSNYLMTAATWLVACATELPARVARRESRA